jgi:PEP-CTERM motif
LFAVGNTGYSSISDVYALANVYGSNVNGSDNVLVLSLTGVKEMTRAGAVAGSLALPGAGYEIEGITMDANGFIYVVSDNGNDPTKSALFVYAPIPEPGTTALLLAGLVAVGGVVRRRAARA